MRSWSCKRPILWFQPSCFLWSEKKLRQGFAQEKVPWSRRPDSKHICWARNVRKNGHWGQGSVVDLVLPSQILDRWWLYSLLEIKNTALFYIVQASDMGRVTLFWGVGFLICECKNSSLADDLSSLLGLCCSLSPSVISLSYEALHAQRMLINHLLCKCSLCLLSFCGSGKVNLQSQPLAWGKCLT